MAKGKTIDDFKNDIDPDPFVLEEKAELRALRAQVTKLKRSIAQREGLMSELADIASGAPVRSEFVPLDPVMQDPSKKKRISEDAVLLLGDLHADAIVPPEHVQGFEDFNFRAVCHRAEHMVDTAIRFLHEIMSGYKFSRLYVFVLGDLVSGEIHNLKAHTEWRDTFKSCLAVSELMAMILSDLSRWFDSVHVVCVPGNHGRRSTRIDWKAPTENWDWLVMQQTKIRCQAAIDSGHLDIQIPEAWSTVVEVQGFNFLLQHGHQNKQNSLGLPHYGLDRRMKHLITLGAVRKIVYHYFIYAHYHRPLEMDQPTGSTFINGAFPATDEYTLEELAGYTDPRQLLFGVHPEKGATWRFPINLRRTDWASSEKTTPKRYQISIS